MLCWTAAGPEWTTDPSKLLCQHQHLEVDRSKCWQPDAYIKVVSSRWRVLSSLLSSSSLWIITVFSQPLTSRPGTKVRFLVLPAVRAVLGFTQAWCQGPLHVSPQHSGPEFPSSFFVHSFHFWHQDLFKIQKHLPQLCSLQKSMFHLFHCK